MALRASEITTSNTLEQFRQQFNNLVTDDAVVNTVPVSFGRDIVLSAVGSTTVNVVSNASSVAPSNTIVPSSTTFTVVVFKLVNVCVPVSNPITSVIKLLNCCLNCSSVPLVFIQ